MKYYSEILKSFFDSEAECKGAEGEFEAKQREAEEKRKALADARKERAKEVEDALKASIEARKHYEELLKEFCHDYGTFHMSLSEPLDLINWFF